MDKSQSLHKLHLLYHYTKSGEKIKSILHRFFPSGIFWRKGGMIMPHLWSLGTSPSHACACQLLRRNNYLIEKEWTEETQGVLLDIPSFRDGDRDWESLFSRLKPGARVFGGNLGNRVPSHLVQFDLLQDAEYTCRNADITARCALRLACGKLTKTLPGLPVLVIGWGRIGKSLAKLLEALGANCSVYARKEADRAMLKALGYSAVNREQMLALLPATELIFNTAPELVIDTASSKRCTGLMVDLASTPGIEGANVLRARGLPGKIAPESSGELIAATVIRLWEENAQ